MANQWTRADILKEHNDKVKRDKKQAKGKEPEAVKQETTDE